MQPYRIPTDLQEGDEDILMDLFNDGAPNMLPRHISSTSPNNQETPKSSVNTTKVVTKKRTNSSTPTAPTTPSKKIPSRPPKQRCYKKRRTEGLEGFLASGPTIDEAIASGLIPPLPVGETKEIRKERRLIRNRVSAQLHRERKKLYVENLERRVQEQAEELDRMQQIIQNLKKENDRLKGGEVGGVPVVCSGSNSTLSPSSSTSCTSASLSSTPSPSSLSNTVGQLPVTSFAHSGSDTDVDISPSSSVESTLFNKVVKTEKKQKKQKKQKKTTQTKMVDGEMEKEKTKTQQDSAYNFSEENPPTTPEQLQAFADDLGLQDFDPNDFDPIEANDFAGFSASTNNLLQLDIPGENDMLNASLLPSPVNEGLFEPKNPKKRAFFLMGMFFFVALFGGAGIFGARQQGNDLFAVESLNAPKKVPMISGSQRRLLSVEKNVVDATVDEKEDNEIFKQESRAVALWQDLTYIHTNSNTTGGTCNIDDLLGSVVNATSLAQGTLIPKEKKNQLRGGVADKAVVPYFTRGHLAQGMFSRSSSSNTTQNALTSALTLQQQMNNNDNNSPTILCPKPYGMLSGSESWKGDARVVLLLPSSSVSFSDSKTTDENEDTKWDGTWVEVDAKISAIRKLPLYQNGIGGSHRRAIPL
jgi:hypothetical protein